MFDDGALPRTARRDGNVLAITISEPRLDVEGLRSTFFAFVIIVVVIIGRCEEVF